MEYSKKFLVRLREELIADEGCVLSIYEDHLGYKTVGVGHLILPSDPEQGKAVGTRITQTRADELLVKDFNNVLKECEERFHNNWIDWPEEVKLIIGNMAFNLGLPRLEKFQLMLKAINKEDYVTASKEGLDSKWADQVYNRAHRLMDRMRSIDKIDNVQEKYIMYEAIDNLTKVLRDALIIKYEGEIASAKANIQVYLHQSVGIGEHTDIVGALDVEVEKMAHAEEKLLAVRNHFVPSQEL